MKSQIIVLVLSLIALSSALTVTQCPAQKSTFCPMFCMEGIYGLNAQGQKIGNCCNQCLCCSNPNVKSVVLDIHPISFPVQNETTYLQVMKPVDNGCPQMCPMFCLESYLKEHGCCNSCLCCGKTKA